MATMAIQKNKLWLKGFSPERSDDDIRRFCDQFGKCVHMARPKNRDYIFLTYCTEEDALQAQAKFVKNRFNCNFAYIPKALDDTGSTSTSSPSNSLPSNSNSSLSAPLSDPEPSTSPQTTSSNKDQRRVHFSNDVVAIQRTPPPTASTQQANQVTNGAANPNDVSATPPPPKTVFRNGEKIIITYVQSASSFYAHSVSKDKERHELIKKISRLAKGVDCVKVPPKFMALAPYKNGYYRAIIKGQANSDDLVLVTLVDIGISLDVPFDQLKPIPNEYTQIKITNRFILDGVDDDSNQSYGAKCLHSFVGVELTMECDGEFAQRLTSVRLIHPDTKQNINDLVKQMQRSFNEDELIRIPAPLGKNQKLCTVDESKLASGFNLITLVDPKDLSEFLEQNKRIQAVGNELKIYPSYEPKDGELCLVMCSGQWHRAIFIEQSTSSDDGDDICVLLIDLLKGVFINSKSIRNVTIELVHMPILSFLANIKGFDQTIDKAKVANFSQKFKMMAMISVKSICESSDAAIYTIEI